jgi:hypothetical protein
MWELTALEPEILGATGTSRQKHQRSCLLLRQDLDAAEKTHVAGAKAHRFSTLYGPTKVVP